MKSKQIIGKVISVLIGLVFIASAVTKYISIDAFDMFIYEHQLFPWIFTTFITRFLIAVECCLGIMLAVGIYPKVIKTTVIAFLVFFSVYILVKPAFFNVDSTNCHCFGTVLILTDKQTLIKNIILLALSYFMFWDKGIKFDWQKYLVIFLGVMSLACVYMINMPDVISYKLYGRAAQIDNEKFEILLQDQNIKNLKITQGRKIVCMYATFCPYCKKSAKRLEVMRQKYNIADSSFALVFWGNEKMVKGFFKKAEVKQLPYTIVSPIKFLDATKHRQPVIILMDNGKVEKLLKYPNINEKDIITFIKAND